LTYKLLIDSKVIKDLKSIDRKWQVKIIDTIKGKLIKNPYYGKKLAGDLSRYYRVRVVNYRIIYEIVEDEKTVIIVKVGHKKYL
jgi:mRNA interferase RelE/StbE